MNIYERPSRPGRGGWNLCFPSPLAADTSVLLSRRYAPFFSPSRRPRNCYSILNMLEFIDNGHLVALFILVSMAFSRNCESKLGISECERVCMQIVLCRVISISLGTEKECSYK